MVYYSVVYLNNILSCGSTILTETTWTIFATYRLDSVRPFSNILLVDLRFIQAAGVQMFEHVVYV
jgi:hypothetical protein